MHTVERTVREPPVRTVRSQPAELAMKVPSKWYPAAHTLQPLAAVLPVAVVVYPAAQAVHVRPLPAAELYFPTSHTVQPSVLAAVTDPE